MRDDSSPTLRLAAALGRSKVRCEDIPYNLPTLGPKLRPHHLTNLMEPRPNPLQSSVRHVHAGLIRLEFAMSFLQGCPLNMLVEGAPVAAAGIEAIKPVLPEIKRGVLDAVESEYAETRP